MPMRSWSRYREIAIVPFRTGSTVNVSFSFRFSAIPFAGEARRKPGQGDARWSRFTLVFQDRYDGAWSFKEQQRTSTLWRIYGAPRGRGQGREYVLFFPHCRDLWSLYVCDFLRDLRKDKYFLWNSYCNNIELKIMINAASVELKIIDPFKRNKIYCLDLFYKFQQILIF